MSSESIWCLAGMSCVSALPQKFWTSVQAWANIDISIHTLDYLGHASHAQSLVATRLIPSPWHTGHETCVPRPMYNVMYLSYIATLPYPTVDHMYLWHPTQFHTPMHSSRSVQGSLRPRLELIKLLHHGTLYNIPDNWWHDPSVFCLGVNPVIID